jgi:hypothetical protein
MSNKYLQVQMQVWALKDHIQAKLCEWRFEVEQFNRVYNEVSTSGMFSIALVLVSAWC